MASPAPVYDTPDPSPAELIAARPHLSMHAHDGLMLEGVPLARIAASLGTPFWAYSAGCMRERLATLTAALAGMDAEVHYAVKANDHLAVLRIMKAGGAGADVVSEGELRRARAAGIEAAHIVFSGVGKTMRELELAISEDIAQINVESAAELEMISAAATRLGRIARVALRINPDVDAGTHAKITTGTAENKFGIAYGEAVALYAHAATLPGVQPMGLALHIGSQIMATAPYRAAYARTADLVHALRARNLPVERVDCGGGLGIGYREAGDGAPAALAGVIRSTLGNLGVRLMVEPGRWLVGPAGVLVGGVVLVKGRFVVLDAAMNDLLRPAMYDAWHGIVPVSPASLHAKLTPTDVVGPICESSDQFAHARLLPPLAAGDLVALLDAGAYGAVMSGTYNARPLPPIALVDGEQWATIRDRQTHQSMWEGERIPEFLT
jgi:diaminopimelate decarboxylase